MGDIIIKIVILTEQQFDYFSNCHPLHTYFQTSMYANLMKRNNCNVFYYGFINQEGILIGAFMMLSSKLIGNLKYGYIPRGPLLDYDDKNLLSEVTELLKQFLSKQKYIFLKIDPPVINNKRDKNGTIIPSNYTNDLISFFTQIGYSYFGENKFFGTLKPRWNAILKVTGSAKTLFDNLESNIKNKIRKADSRGVQVIQGTHNDLEVFYSFVAKKHYRNLEYYKNFAECFQNKFELYFAKLNSQEYLANIKKIIEEEIENNEKINLEIQKAGQSNSISTKLTNSKIHSDKLLAIFKKELIQASELFEKSPKGIIIGACAVIIENNNVQFLIDGYDQDYSLFYPTFLIKWHIIEKYAKLGAVYFDLNAITGYFEDNNKFRGLNEMKLGFNADVTEYIGEFDLVINDSLYNFLRKTKIINKKMKKHNK